MHTQINFTATHAFEVSTLNFGDRPDPWLSLELNSNDGRVSLMVRREVAQQIANVLLDAVRELTPEPENVADLSNTLSCDYCGQVVESDNDVSEADPSFEWWRHADGSYACTTVIDGTRRFDQHVATVNGSKHVVRYKRTSSAAS